MSYPSPLTKSLIRDACDVAKTAHTKGWTAGTAGNFSVREADPSLAWVSPSGLVKSMLDPKRFIRIATDTAMPIGSDYRTPSAESPIHCAIFRKIGYARAVVHLHPPALVQSTLASTKPLSFKNQEMIKALGLQTHATQTTLPTLPNSQDMLKLSKEVAKVIDPYLPILVLQGHGIYAWADSPWIAYSLIEGVEFLCQSQP